MLTPDSYPRLAMAMFNLALAVLLASLGCVLVLAGVKLVTAAIAYGGATLACCVGLWHLAGVEVLRDSRDE